MATSWGSSGWISGAGRSSETCLTEGRRPCTPLRRPGRPHRWGMATILGLLIAGGSAPVLATPAHASTQQFMLTNDCQEEQAFVDGDPAAVAAQLPRGYRALQDPSTNAPIVFLRGERCGSVSVGGATAPATMASFGVVIQTPDGTGCSSAAPGIGTEDGDMPPLCNWYTLGWLTNSRAVARWFQAEAPGFPVQFASGLDFHLGALEPTQGGTPFRLSVPSSTHSPFTMNALTRQRPGPLSVRGGYWVGAPGTAIKLVFASDDLTSGDASGLVSAPAGTRVATLLGAVQRPYLPGYSAISAEHWDSAVYRLQHPASAPGSTSFAGSCSMQGTVTFDPPATNTAQPLSYTYSSKGTCSGTLDGRQLSNAPAMYQQSGSSYASCSHAQTTAPGQGALRFTPDQVIAVTEDFTSEGTEVNETIYGDRSGMAPAHGTFLTPRTSPAVVADCAGPGARVVPMDLTLATETPLVSVNHGSAK